MNRISILDGLPLSLRVLDFYAGEAKWITPILRGFNVVDLWEIQPIFEKTLRERMPHANVTIGDSYQMAQLGENRHRFDLVLMDNHVGVYADYFEERLPEHKRWHHVEHFEALEHVATLLGDGGGYLVLNVCTDPILLLIYNYLRNFRALWENTCIYWRKLRDGTFSRWLHGRAEFYGFDCVTRRVAETVYSEYFAKRGLVASGFTWEKRRPFLYLLRMRLIKYE